MDIDIKQNKQKELQNKNIKSEIWGVNREQNGYLKGNKKEKRKEKS